MKSYMICETKKFYHLVEVSEEINMEETIKIMDSIADEYDSGYEAVSTVLEKLKNTYGFDYEIKCNYCGTEIDGLSIVDEVE